MRLRWVFAAAATTLVATALSIGFAARYFVLRVQSAEVDVSGFTQEQLEVFFAEMNRAWVYMTLLPWLATAALIGLVATLALAALRARLGQRASDSATASREASTAASRS